MSRIFVSYSRDDQPVVRRLVEDVESLGHTVWFDEELSGGQVWWDEVLANIRRSDVFIVAVSTQTLSSTACKREYGYADDLGKPLLPIIVAEGVSTNLLPPALSRVQLVSYRGQDRGEAFRLARAITSLPAGRPLPDPLPVPPEVPISYLGQLTERVESLSRLEANDQSALLLDLRRSMQDADTRDDARTLLERLRKRRDLLATVAEEIDLVLRGAVSPPPPLSARSPNPSFELPPLPAEPQKPPSPVDFPRSTGIDRPPITGTGTQPRSVPLMLALALMGPLAWAVTLRRNLKDVAVVLLASFGLFMLSALFFAEGDGIDGYSDDMWEYGGTLLVFATWWWPFAVMSFRSKVFARKPIDVVIS